MDKGCIFVISGTSGVGKSTVLAKVMEKRKDLIFSVSATTRAPRPGEKEGVDYYFVTQEQFRKMIDQDEFLEYDAHMNNSYGTPKAQVEEKRKKGHVILDIDPNGAYQVRTSCPEAVLIFIAPPSMEELERRLRGRGDTSPEQMELRLHRARWELAQQEKYDYVVVNNQVDACVDEILKIIEEKAN